MVVDSVKTQLRNVISEFESDTIWKHMFIMHSPNSIQKPSSMLRLKVKKRIKYIDIVLRLNVERLLQIIISMTLHSRNK